MVEVDHRLPTHTIRDHSGVVVAGVISGSKETPGTANTGSMEGRKEMFYLTMHSTHFIYGYIVSYIW